MFLFRFLDLIHSFNSHQTDDFSQTEREAKIGCSHTSDVCAAQCHDFGTHVCGVGEGKRTGGACQVS